MGITDILTADYFCNLIGVATVETSSIKKDNSLEGAIEQYGQKNISTIERNLLNKDEILRMPASKLIVNVRGNKPLLLDKVIYTEHELSKELKDSSIYDYTPKWVKNNINDMPQKENQTENTPKKDEKLEWNSF